jgi:RNA polymerase sigma-70 factor (ECF subfamily)
MVRQRRLDRRLAEQHVGRAHPDPSARLGAADLLRRLPDDRRSAFVLTQALGLAYAEATTVEGVPVGTVRSRVTRARAELVGAVNAALAN